MKTEDLATMAMLWILAVTCEAMSEDWRLPGRARDLSLLAGLMFVTALMYMAVRILTRMTLGI